MSKITTVLSFVLSFILLVSAQTPPSCATSCFISSPPTGCSQTDFGCICKDQAYISKIACCAVAACPASDLQVNLCQGSGVTIDATPPTNCPGSAGVANGTTNSSTASGPSASASGTIKSSAPSNFANNLASLFTVTGTLIAGYFLL